uniref:Uncharacterized protein n=2 Tax=Bionectria ochroleuca TaxID=29856 RepID=A0A0B7KFY0_BIOOC
MAVVGQSRAPAPGLAPGEASGGHKARSSTSSAGHSNEPGVIVILPPMPPEVPLPLRIFHNIPSSTTISSSTVQPQPCAIPHPQNDDFVRRPDLVEQLDTLLPTTSEFNSAALWGLGGSGKSQLALDYAYRRRQDPECSIFWVHADNETTFVRDYQIIARELGIELGSFGNIEDVLLAVRDRIEALPSWVLILDSADQLSVYGVGPVAKAHSLFNYIPRGRGGTLLWTSRDGNIVGTLVNPYRGVEVKGMTLNEAVRLLELTSQRSIHSAEHSAATVLVDNLQRLPLAISQVGAYIQRRQRSISRVVFKLSNESSRWRILKEPEARRQFPRPGVLSGVLQTWNVSMRRLRSESEVAYRILHILAFTDGQRIRFGIIAAAGIDFSQDDVADALQRLVDFSFLRPLDTDGNCYEMHILVQEAIRYGLRQGHDRQDELYFSNMALQTIINLFPDPFGDSWFECENYLTHAMCVSEWAELCQKEVEVSDLLQDVSSYLICSCRWKEAELVLTRAYTLRSRLLGGMHAKTLDSMERLAGVYYEQGIYGKAEEVEAKVFDLRQRILGETHPDTLWTRGRLATIYDVLGQHDKAREIGLAVFKTRQNVLGDRHPDTIWALSQLGNTYHQMAQYGEAEEIELRVLKLRREVLGEKHPSTIWTMAKLGMIYDQQNQHAKAEGMQVRALKLGQEVLGESHPHTLTALSELGLTYIHQGRVKEAEKLLSEVLERRRNVLGGHHPDTIITMRRMVAIYHHTERFEEAEKMEDEISSLQGETLAGTSSQSEPKADLASIFMMSGGPRGETDTPPPVIDLKPKPSIRGRQAAQHMSPHSHTVAASLKPKPSMWKQFVCLGRQLSCKKRKQS